MGFPIRNARPSALIDGVMVDAGMVDPMPPTPDVADTDAYAPHINEGLTFRMAQHLTEDAILKADEGPR